MKLISFFSIISNLIFANLLINEIHYNPSSALQGSDEHYEFIEFYNNSNETINLNGYSIYMVTGWGWWPDYDKLIDFNCDQFIEPFSYFIVSSDESVYDFAISTWDDHYFLPNNQETTILLYDSPSCHNVIDHVTYNDDYPWPEEADAQGYSLILEDVNLNNENYCNWTYSSQIGGSPGFANLENTISGCTDINACNFDNEANTDDGSCEYPDDGYNCENECIIDIDCNGICGGNSIEDCSGECNGNAEFDECGVCNGPGAEFECYEGNFACDISGCYDSAMLSFGEINANSIQILYSSTEEISGAQFNLIGANIESSTGGITEEIQWNISISSNTWLGFSFSGVSIPSGSGILTVLEFSDPELELCIDNGVLSNSMGLGIEVIYGDCIVPIQIYGCTDINACNYNAEANFDDNTCEYPNQNFDCEGNCILEIDCAGECGGNSIIDDCGVCGGPGLIFECGCNESVFCSNGIEVCDISECSQDNQYFIDLPAETGVNQLVVIGNVLGLDPGDEIGLYDVNGLINSGDCSNTYGEILVGSGIWDGNQLEIVAIGSLDLCDAGGPQLAGWKEGNPIEFRVWDSSANYEYIASAGEFTVSGGNWGDILTVLGELDGFIYGCTDENAANYNENADLDDGSCYFNTSMQFVLEPNYVNNISYCLWHFDMTPEIFFGINESIIVSDDESNLYIPEFNINSYESDDVVVDYNNGFLYFHDNNDIINLEINGFTFSHAQTITLSPNYLNNIAYHLEYNSSIADQFTGIPVLLIADDAGNYFIPTLGINTIDDNGGMTPGKGYYIYIYGDENINFNYNHEAPMLNKNTFSSSEDYYFNPNKTGISIPIKVDAENIPNLEQIDEIGIYLNNTLSGVVKIKDDIFEYNSMIWLDNNIYSMEDIFNENTLSIISNDLVFKYISKNNNEISDLTFDTTIQLPLILLDYNNYSNDIIDINISGFELLDPYPNPFNPVTTISYRLPKDTIIKLEVYNIDGNLITTIFNGFQVSGNYEVEWNAINFSSGVYFVKLNIDDFSKTQKLILVK